MGPFTELADPSGASKLPKGLRPALRMSTALGFAGGFLMAYQRSSYRFWGWSENVRFPPSKPPLFPLAGLRPTELF